MNVTDEHVHEGKVLPRLVEDIIKSKYVRIHKVLADGAYDSNAVFRCLSNNRIIPWIKLRKNAKVKSTNHVLRNLMAISQKNDLQRWKDSVSCGQRWIIGTVFSTIKRTFGEYVYSIKFENMVKEMVLKALLYNKLVYIKVKHAE